MWYDEYACMNVYVMQMDFSCEQLMANHFIEYGFLVILPLGVLLFGSMLESYSPRDRICIRDGSTPFLLNG